LSEELYKVMMSGIREEGEKFAEGVGDVEMGLFKEGGGVKSLAMREEVLTRTISELVEMISIGEVDGDQPKIWWELLYYCRSLGEVRAKLIVARMNVQRV